jgi:hypothetical protein
MPRVVSPLYQHTHFRPDPKKSRDFSNVNNFNDFSKNRKDETQVSSEARKICTHLLGLSHRFAWSFEYYGGRLTYRDEYGNEAFEDNKPTLENTIAARWLNDGDIQRKLFRRKQDCVWRSEWWRYMATNVIPHLTGSLELEQVCEPVMEACSKTGWKPATNPDLIKHYSVWVRAKPGARKDQLASGLLAILAAFALGRALIPVENAESGKNGAARSSAFQLPPVEQIYDPSIKEDLAAIKKDSTKCAKLIFCPTGNCDRAVRILALCSNQQNNSGTAPCHFPFFPLIHFVVPSQPFLPPTTPSSPSQCHHYITRAARECPRAIHHMGMEKKRAGTESRGVEPNGEIQRRAAVGDHAMERR